MSSNYPVLFTPVKIGNVEIKNRIALAPMSLESLIPFENGYVDNRCKEYLIERAKGGTGLIIFSCWRVDTEIEPLHHFHCNYLSDAAMYSLIELNEILHSFEAKVFYQLTAGFGRVGSAHPPGGGLPVAPSAVPHFWEPDITCRALETAEVEQLVAGFGLWAGKLAKSGADGIELHAHEGYLFDQFSSAVWNKRTDKYGGDLEGRLTFAKEILRQIKDNAGEDFPVIYRYGLKHYMKGDHSAAVPGEEFAEYGRDTEEGLEMARILEREGFDGLHVDAGAYDSWYWPHPPNYMPHGIMAPLAGLARQAVDIPIIAVGRMDDPDVAARTITDGQADMVAVGRGLLADAEWTNKVRYGNLDDIRPCLGCHDACTGRLFNGKPMCCAVNPAVGRELDYVIHPAPTVKKVMVIGGGPGGMEAARVAALRGHEVHLYEAADHLGGMLDAAGVPEFKKDVRRLVAWYEKQLADTGVTVHLNTKADAELVSANNPDEIIVATGSEPIIIGFGDGDQAEIVHCTEVLTGATGLGQRVVVIGGGLVGCETALWAAERGHDVALIEMLPALMSAGPLVSKENRQMTIDLLAFKGVDVRLETMALAVEGDRLKLERDGEAAGDLGFDTLVLAVGMKPRQDLFHELDSKFENVRRIGDCLQVRNIQGAIWDAMEVARRI